MKKLFVAISLLALAACAKTDAPVPQDTGGSTEKLHFHGVARVPETRGVAQMDKLWHNGTTILVKFLNGAAADRAIVQNAAAEWEQHANIKFRFVDSGNAHVRIHFDEDYMRWVTWSYTGTDCKFITDQAEPTAFFACWDGMSSGEKQTESRRVLGQILGLELEHRHQDFTPDFRTTIRNYWAGVLPDVVWNELSKYVLDPLEAMNVPENIVQTAEFDAGSIMVWPFLHRMYVNNPAYPLFGNDELSRQDIAFIGQLYPKTNEFVELLSYVMAGWTLEENYFFPELYGSKDIFVDFGYGASWEGSSNGLYYDVRYPVLTEDDVVTIFGEADAIDYIEVIGGTLLKLISIPEHTKIKRITLYDIKHFGSFKIENNPYLERINGYFETIKRLDLTGMPSLRSLEIWAENIEEFIFPDNIPSLREVSFQGNCITDEALMTALANALPDMTGLSEPGRYIFRTFGLYPQYPAQSVLDILSSKNWVATPDNPDYW